MIPRLVEHYRAQVACLPALMAAEPAAAREALGELLGEVEITRDERGAVWAQVAGFGDLFLMMVAGAGFEPTTFGL